MCNLKSKSLRYAIIFAVLIAVAIVVVLFYFRNAAFADEVPPVAAVWANSTDITFNTDFGKSEYVEFSAANSTDNVGVSSYQWDFGDATTGSGKTIIHFFSQVDNFTVTVTVADEAGNQDVATIEIEVYPTILFP